jgi:hypothetical protein
MADSTCLETKVRNMSGKAAVFGFLPPHGKKLAAGDEYTFFGSMTGLLQAITSKRKREAFIAAVKSGDIVVVSTPSPLFYDETLDVTKTIKVANNSISTADPCGITYSSSI